MKIRSRAIALVITLTLLIEMTVTPSMWMVYATEEPDASEETPEHFLSEKNVTEKARTILYIPMMTGQKHWKYIQEISGQRMKTEYCRT